jgi:protein KRI1
MRRVDDRRKQQRLSAKDKKEEEKNRRKEEINRLKALKRDEIMDKLKKTEFIAGNFTNDENKSILTNKKLLEKAERELQTEFIPDLYDKAMEQIFDEKYYAAQDEQADDISDQPDINFALLNDGKIEDVVESELSESEKSIKDD